MKKEEKNLQGVLLIAGGVVLILLMFLLLVFSYKPFNGNTSLETDNQSVQEEDTSLGKYFNGESDTYEDTSLFFNEDPFEETCEVNSTGSVSVSGNTVCVK